MEFAPNPIAAARNALFPWSVAYNLRGRKRYPGRFNGICELVGKQAAHDTVKDWLSGRRSAPRWLIKLLWDTLEQRRQADRAVQILLENYQYGPGTGCALREWQKKRAARAALSTKDQTDSLVS